MRLLQLFESLEEYANQAVKLALQNLDWSGGDAEWLWQDYYASTGDERSEDELSGKWGSPEDPQALQWFENIFAERVYDKEDDIKTLADWDGNEIIIYREITASEDWLSSAEIITAALGVFWSWDKNAAEAHWGSFGSGHVHWLIVSKVPKGRVDWPSTLAKNASFSAEDEKEIEVMEGTPLPLLAVYAGGIHGTEVDLGALKGKKFSA